MERYIGLDAHASSCTLGIVGPSGKRLGSQVVETNARALIEVLRGIPRNRHLCLEEGTLSGWLYEVLKPHVEELTVAGVGKSRGPKTDKLDAFALAEKLRIGSLETTVYKNRGQFRRLGERAKSYDFLVGDTVRVKNRLKSVLRSRGVAYGAGRSVYLKRDREEWLAKLPETRGLNRNFNHTLKRVFKGAATTVIGRAENEPLYRHYERLLEGGTKPNLAKLTIARQLASIVLAVWRTGEAYDPKRLEATE